MGVRGKRNWVIAYAVKIVFALGSFLGFRIIFLRDNKKVKWNLQLDQEGGYWIQASNWISHCRYGYLLAIGKNDDPLLLGQELKQINGR